MGMFDTIYGVIVKCPRCGDYDPKSVQIKTGPQILDIYQFGRDKIDIDWDYEYYGSVIDREKRIIRGVADCDKCKKESDKKIEGLFDVAIWLDKDNIPIVADNIEKINRR